MSQHRCPPGPRGLPVVGNTLHWMRDSCAFRERCARHYGSVVRYDVVGQETYMVTDPAAIKRVLEDTETFPKHEWSTDQLSEIVGQGLLTSEGSLWERQREAIQPAFYMDQIKRYGDIIASRSEMTAARFEDGTVTDIHAEMMRCTLEILVEAMFGTDIDLAERGIYDAVEARLEPMKPRKQPITFMAPDWLPVPFLRRAQAADDHLEAQVLDILADRRQRTEDRTDLLAMLIDAETDMSDEQIRDEMLTFLLAGHETTALTLTYAWHLLADAPTVEQRLHEEVDTLAGQPTVDDVFGLEYTEAVIKESMRLFPPAHEIRREPACDVEIGGYHVPAGALITLPSWVVHRDDRFWDDPEQFRPARFLTDSDRPEYAYFPFGGGPRRCIGQLFAMTEAQLVVATLAREWTFERTYDDLELAAAVTLQPADDVELRTTRRSVDIDA